jgi:2-polyprenyl-6-methoxyphenol hydroxylase-like FAD-dependent oxidoreductase
MMMQKPITIIGGGLAGLTLGIGLRRQGVPVTVWEAGRYPRHRVCGEFISGHGLRVLEGLGGSGDFLEHGARVARTAALFCGQTHLPPQILPEPALCWSRYHLDAFLAEEFGRVGGDLRQNTRWRAEARTSGTVRATGRRILTSDNGWRYFGLKAHARNISLTADLEMHLIPQGYVGLCQLSGEMVNVCGLFRSRTALPELATRWLEFLQGETGSPLHRRLASAVFEKESFCSVAGLSLKPRRADAGEDCSIGDAITMIAPVTGNGMSMAFESAALAVAPLAGYSCGALDWNDARRIVAAQCDNSFARRLRWASWLESGLFLCVSRAALVFLLARWPWIWRALFARTR